MKKKAVILAILLAGMVGLSGCKAWDVVCDVLAVGTTKVEKDDSPKVDLAGVTPDVQKDESSEATEKKMVMPSETPTPSITATPTPTPRKEKRESEKTHMITCISPVNVRDAASSQSHVIGELAKGDQVEKLGEDGGWIKIRYQGQEAWVYEDYMSEKNSQKEKIKTDKNTDISADEGQESYNFEKTEKTQKN